MRRATPCGDVYRCCLPEPAAPPNAFLPSAPYLDPGIGSGRFATQSSFRSSGDVALWRRLERRQRRGDVWLSRPSLSRSDASNWAPEVCKAPLAHNVAETFGLLGQACHVIVLPLHHCVSLLMQTWWPEAVACEPEHQGLNGNAVSFEPAAARRRVGSWCV